MPYMALVFVGLWVPAAFAVAHVRRVHFGWDDGREYSELGLLLIAGVVLARVLGV